MRTLLNLAHCHGAVLGTSWQLVLATLQVRYNVWVRGQPFFHMSMLSSTCSCFEWLKEWRNWKTEKDMAYVVGSTSYGGLSSAYIVSLFYINP